MSAVVVRLANAVAAALNSEPLAPGLVAVREYMPLFDLGKIGADAQVIVSPGGLVVTPVSRSHAHFDFSVEISVQRRVSHEDTDQIDAMFGLVERIEDRLRQKELDSMPEAQWIGSEHEPFMPVEHLERMSVFTAVMTITYRVRRQTG
ncbi:MAG: hypothetical protein EA379_01305 [Phycisphaerales bacterium]|nr:MAG: hypothetical protein EA379_01305 [Phycisphaerales bacterium]